MGRIVLFQRVSTLEQHLESQEDVLKRAALADGYNEADFIIIGKKESAIKLSEEEREGIKELKSIIEKEDVDCVYITELSRLSRNADTLYSIRKYLLKKKVQLKCLNPLFTLLTKDRTKFDPHSNIIFSIFGTLAEQEMVEKKERFARGKKQKAKEGKYSGGRIPFGYRAYPERNNIIDYDLREKEIVKMIFDMYEKGYSQPKIAIELNNRGYTNPRYKEAKLIQLGQIAHILNNRCYTGELLEEKVVKVKDNENEGRERQWIRYARKYPQIISVEQFERCREIAKANRTLIGKGKNIYYATKLVRCPSCGCYWSASSSKVHYHCYNALKLPKIWAVDGRTTEQCKNRTTLSINVLDSLLWYFAKREESYFIQQASSERKEMLQKKIAEYQSNIEAIPPQIEAINTIIENYAIRNAEGHISNERFEIRVLEQNKEKSKLLDKKLTLQDKIEELQQSINKIDEVLNTFGVNVKPINKAAQFLDALYERFKQCNAIYKNVCDITDDNKRYEIIHRVIERVYVENVKIKYKYKVGWKDARAKKIIICTPDWFSDNSKNGCLMTREYTIYYLPFSGGKQGIFLSTNDESPIENTTIYYDGSVIGHAIEPEWSKDYSNKGEVQFENEDSPSVVSIIDIPYLNRFTDLGKKERYKIAKEEAYKEVKGYLRIEEVAAMGNLTNGQVYFAISKGWLKAQSVRHKYFIAPHDAENYISKLEEQRNSRGEKISAYEVAKRLNKRYSSVLSCIRQGKIPSEQVKGHYLLNLEDAVNYFTMVETSPKGM